MAFASNDQDGQPKEPSFTSETSEISQQNQPASVESSEQMDKEPVELNPPTNDETSQPPPAQSMTNLSKYNYLFYFIYKYKYENRTEGENISDLSID